MTTKIEWAQETWNPVTGCTPISEGCQNCYAKRMANRLRGRYGYPADEPFRPATFHPDKLDKPLKWKKPRMVFVCSMGDIFHPDVKSEWIQDVWDTMHDNPQHTFLLLTKRPEEIPFRHKSWWFKNIWLGVTAENQKRADERIPILLQIPAAVHFVSIEPMLEYVNLDEYVWKTPHIDRYRVGWTIVGAETGPGARPMNPRWAIDLYEQCKISRTPFFFKKESRDLPVPDRIKVREYPK